MEKRVAGQEWFMLTCLSLMLPALKGCHKDHSMDYLTVVGFLEQVVHQRYLILPSTTTRFVGEWLDINKICPEHFVIMLMLINFTLLDWLLCMVVPVSTSGHIRLVMTTISIIYGPVHVTKEAHIRSLHSLAMTTTVNLVTMDPVVAVIPVFCTLMMCCGMENNVMV